MAQSLNIGNFKVYQTGGDFILDGKPAPCHPMVLHPCGAIFLPVSDYLYERAVMNNAAVGSTLDEANILCSWLNHLHSQGLSWKDASDEQITSHAHALLNRGVMKKRVERCVSVTFRFYLTAQSRLGLIKDLLEDPALGKVGAHYPISVHLSKKGLPQARFQFTTTEEGPGRPTPESHEVERILDDLLDRTNIERATCFWLAASLMYRSGLREQGVAALTLSILASALKSEGIHEGGRPYSLHEAAEKPEMQDRILTSLGELGLRGRTRIFVRVTEKGAKTRDVPIAVELIENILLYIWTSRSELVRMLYFLRRDYKNCDALFLSLKTGEGLQKKSIGNLINTTFKKLSIPGSAHRLRAAFAESVVRDCYLRARAAHGTAWDRNAVLLEVAEALGHASTGSLDHYLNRIIREQQLIEGEPILVTSPPDLEDVRAMVNFVNSGNIRFVNEMRALLAKHGHTPERVR